MRLCPTRLYKRSDRNALVNLWISVFADAFPQLRDPPASRQFHRYWDEVIAPEQQVWVAERSSQPVGFISVTPEAVCNLFVAVAAQRTGVGTALLRCALAAEPAICMTSTIASNTPARSFYEKNGFVLDGMEPHTFRDELRAKYRLVEQTTD